MLDPPTACFVSVDRTAPAANGQVRVWVTVGKGEQVMLKLPAGADVAQATERHLANLRAEAERQEREAAPTRRVDALRARDLPDELARVEAELVALTARRDALVTRTGDIARVR